VEVISKINASIQKTLSLPRVKKQFIDSGNLPIAGSASDLDQLVKNETALYKTLLTNAKITLD
jgi:tripartite-type tricarboxylate transporter receptor subunit TctC